MFIILIFMDLVVPKLYKIKTSLDMGEDWKFVWTKIYYATFKIMGWPLV